MKKLFLFFILTLSFQSLTKADDISDFEIEGISIGDSALDHFSRSEIVNATKTYYPKSKKYYSVHIVIQSKNYDQVSFGVKDNDNNYIIVKVSGDKHFIEKPSLCLTKLEEVSKDFDKQFGKSNKRKYTHKFTTLDDGSSYSEVIDYSLNDNSAIRLWCNFFTKNTIKKRDLANGLTVSLDSDEWLTWLNKEAY